MVQELAFYSPITGNIHAAVLERAYLPGAGDYTRYVPGRAFGKAPSLESAAKHLPGVTIRLI